MILASNSHIYLVNYLVIKHVTHTSCKIDIKIIIFIYIKWNLKGNIYLINTIILLWVSLGKLFSNKILENTLRSQFKVYIQINLPKKNAYDYQLISPSQRTE